MIHDLPPPSPHAPFVQVRSPDNGLIANVAGEHQGRGAVLPPALVQRLERLIVERPLQITPDGTERCMAAGQVGTSAPHISKATHGHSQMMPNLLMPV